MVTVSPPRPRRPEAGRAPAPAAVAPGGPAKLAEQAERAERAENIAPYLADFERFVAELPAGEPAALTALRRAAIERFAALGFPTLRQEEWRFTNVAPITRGSFVRVRPPTSILPVAPVTPLAPVTAAAPGAPDARSKDGSLAEHGAQRALAALAGSGPGGGLAELECDVAARLVFIGGHFAPSLSRLGELPPGVVVGSLAEALARPRPAHSAQTDQAAAASIEAHLGRHASFAEQPFVALNTAFFADGAFVELPRGAVVEKPIHLLYLGASGSEIDGGGAGEAAGAAPAGGPIPVAYPRTLIVLGEGSQATVVESYGGSGAYFTCAVTEIVAGPGAVVDHYKVQRESREAFHLATFQLDGERGGNLSSHSISLGGGLVRNDVNAVLGGEGIDCILNGLYLAEGRQLVDNHMRVEHVKPHCASHELYKGILDGKARSVFNGLIHVHHGAQKTDAKQSNRNLLLSRDAIANSNPQLEIFADDVKCTHGSTVGQLDDDAVFYLRSRGIGEQAARSLLTYAFAAQVVERIRVAAVRHDLEEFLFARLPRGEVVRQAI